MILTKEEALFYMNDIWSVTDELNTKHGLTKGISRAHHKNVALCAEKIAAACGMDSNRAYVQGLMHDYGEAIEGTTPNTFHGTAGYDILMNKGYDEVARTCLTHSFWEGVFDESYFPSYNQQEIKRAISIISKIGIDEYDKLIQISDMLSSGYDIIPVETRVNIIVKKYKLPHELIGFKLQKACELKAYFDNKCGRSIYEILGINDAKL